MASKKPFYSKYCIKKPLTTYQQQIAMASEYPCFTLKDSTGRGNGTITWEGRIRPSPLSSEYLVQIKYTVCERTPAVQVLSPKLITKHGELPHIYPSTGNLCLFYKYDNYDKIWAPEKPITLIVPWISSWLIFYEIFEITGKWEGGGIEHPHSVTKEAN
jgi:hypothetical protein